MDRMLMFKPEITQMPTEIIFIGGHAVRAVVILVASTFWNRWKEKKVED